MRLRVLTWNLMHGRAVPPAGRDLQAEFGAVLAGWEWDLALLQEVPPWWPELLAAGAGQGTEHRLVLTSRNALLPLRRALAVRWPDAIKSNGGGANAILVRAPGLSVVAHATLRLCLRPERRQLQAVRLVAAGQPLWVGNLHATVHDDAGARRDCERARVALLRWAAGAPVLLGGDFNVRDLELAGLDHAGGHDVDHFFVSGLEPLGAPQTLQRGALSDHAPVALTLMLPQ
ncbi:MAG: endonuclease/exonuclease/phosphatase family protein [Solirubrobacterales bacterium]|nr:endonuclease/exonuclease/phosphatase family protein [Solirubrobacterales bacterium]